MTYITARPFALIGFTYFAALLLALQLDTAQRQVLGAAFLLLSVAALIWRTDKRLTRTVVITVSVAFAALNVYTCVFADNARGYDGREAVISGTVISQPEYEHDNGYAVLRVDSVDGERCRSFKVRLSYSPQSWVHAYDRVTTRVKMYLPFDSSDISSAASQNGEGIFIDAYAPEVIDSVSPDSYPPMYYIISAREHIGNIIARNTVGDEYAVISGIILGDTSDMSEELANDIRRVGAGHLFVVSGLHISVLAGSVYSLLRAAGKNIRVSSVAMLIVIFFLTALTGFSVSAVRAGIMSCVCYIGGIFYRRSDPVNSLGLAAVIILAFNPYAVLSISFLLSFGATFGVAVLSEPISRRAKAALHISDGTMKCWFVDIISQTVAVSIVTLPISVMCLGTLSLVSPISNLFMIPLGTLCLQSAALFTLLSVVGLGSIAAPVRVVMTFAARCMVGTAELFSEVPSALVSVNSDHIKLWFAASLLIFAAFLRSKSFMKNIKVPILLSGILLCVFISSHEFADIGVGHVTVLDDGNGIAVAVEYSGGSGMVVCGNGDLTATRCGSYLGKNAVTELDFLLMPDDDTRFGTINGLPQMSRCIIVPPNSRIRSEMEMLYPDSDRILSSRDTVFLAEGIELAVSEQGKSQAIRLVLCGTTYVIINGDIDCSLLPQDWLSADVLITGKDTPINAELFSADLAVVSSDNTAGGNTVVRLKEIGMNTTATAGLGMVKISGRNGAVKATRG